ncbi:MAG TPA: SRPBCC family protein, partial [Micromonosporaceae bacterium]|nr:SRPBCC family protein [Micromonosporaceae bacterium]
MSVIEEQIEVDVPLRTAYDQWTQFEDFPAFMEGVQEVRQLDDRRLAWRAEIMGKEVS